MAHSVEITFPSRGNYVGFQRHRPRDRRNTIKQIAAPSVAEVLDLRHEGRILGQGSNPVAGSRSSQASLQWDKQHRVQPVPS